MATQTYVVTSDRHRVVHRDDQFRVTGSTFYSRGEKIDLEESEAERLLKTGGLMTVEDYEKIEGQQVLGLNAASTPVVKAPESDTDVVTNPAATAPDGPAALSGQTADPGLVDDDMSGAESTAPEDESQQMIGPQTGAPHAVNAGDQFAGMSYPQLQQQAKDAGLNAGGTAEDLRTRLRAHRQQESLRAEAEGEDDE